MRTDDPPPSFRRRSTPRSLCPACGVESATVDGACTNCWALKENRRSGFAPERTEPFWRDGSDGGRLWAAVGGSTCLGLIVLAVVFFGLDALIIVGVVVAVLALGWGLVSGNLP